MIKKTSHFQVMIWMRSRYMDSWRKRWKSGLLKKILKKITCYKMKTVKRRTDHQHQQVDPRFHLHRIHHRQFRFSRLEKPDRKDLRLLYHLHSRNRPATSKILLLHLYRMPRIWRKQTQTDALSAPCPLYLLLSVLNLRQARSPQCLSAKRSPASLLITHQPLYPSWRTCRKWCWSLQVKQAFRVIIWKWSLHSDKDRFHLICPQITALWDRKTSPQCQTNPNPEDPHSKEHRRMDKVFVLLLKRSLQNEFQTELMKAQMKRTMKMYNCLPLSLWTRWKPVTWKDFLETHTISRRMDCTASENH